MERATGAARRLLASVYPRSELPPRSTAAETCRAIRNGNDVTILAHQNSGSKSLSDAGRARLYHRIDGHVDGIELYHPKNGSDYRKLEASIVGTTGCLYTGGSDRHFYGSDHPISKAPETCMEQFIHT